MIPETKAFCPRGLGIIPYALPSSVALAEATIKELNDYDVVMWENMVLVLLVKISWMLSTRLMC